MALEKNSWQPQGPPGRKTFLDRAGNILQAKEHLLLSECPHCAGTNPTLVKVSSYNAQGAFTTRKWWVYSCNTCGGVICAETVQDNSVVVSLFPTGFSIDPSIPARVAHYLSEASKSLSTPSGSIMVAASAVDSMLKAHGLRDGNLYDRINKAAEDHLITKTMATWAHNVRLEANIERHTDDSYQLPTTDDAQRTFDFAIALAQYLYVIPAAANAGIRPETK